MQPIRFIGAPSTTQLDNTQFLHRPSRLARRQYHPDMTLRVAGADGRSQRQPSLVLAAIVAALLLGRAEPLRASDADLWYLVTLQGQHAGWMHVRTTRQADDAAGGGERITTEMEWTLTVSRAGTSVASRKQGRFIETADGRPISMWSLQDLGSAPREAEYEFGPEHVTVRITEAGRTTTTTRPMPGGEWKTPHQAAEFLAARVRGGADSITLTAIDALGEAAPVTITRELLHRDQTIEVRGKKVRATRWKTVQANLPNFAATEYFDPQGVLVRSEVDLGGMVIVTVLADEAAAKRVGAGPEMMLSTFVEPSRPIARPAHLRRAVFDLSVAESGMPELPSTGAQSVEAIEGGARQRLTVDVARRQTEQAEDANQCLGASDLINTTDARVVELAGRAVRGVRDDPLKRAEAIRVYVNRYIRRKSLGVGLASAADVAASREGDCTEHAVLTAAMLRTQGIPARVATGLVLVDEIAGRKSIFGYHMWTQALIDGCWVDFDAAQAHRFDATHIALSVSALDDGALLSEITSILPLMGRLRIDVVELEY